MNWKETDIIPGMLVQNSEPGAWLIYYNTFTGTDAPYGMTNLKTAEVNKYSLQSLLDVLNNGSYTAMEVPQ